MPELFVSALLAGACIGLGSVASLFAPNPMLGAVFFSVGLLYVRIRGFALLTGQNQYLGRGVPLKRWLVVLGGNFSGMIVLALAAYLAKAGNAPELAVTAAQKFAAAPLSYFFPAVFCGCLMTVATHPKTEMWISTLCVAAFILCGFRHCVADVFWLVLGGWKPMAFLSWLIIVVGNLAGGWLLGWGMRKAEAK